MKFQKVKGPQNHHLFLPVKADGTVGDTYWVKYYKASRGRLENSLKTRSLSDARILRDKKIADFVGQRMKVGSRIHLVEDLFPEFLELKKGKSAGTYRSIEVQWRRHLKDFFGGMAIDEVDNNAWLKYVNSKRRASPDRKFFNDRKYLSMFLKWLHESELISSVPSLSDEDPEIDAGKAYTDDEIEGLLSCSMGVLHLQILMAYTMGMRRGEIYSLEWKQIDWKKGTIFLPKEKVKTRQARTFAMSEEAKQALKFRFDCDGNKSRWVFPHPDDPSRCHGPDGTKYAWEKLLEETGIKGRFHDLRHTFLTKAFKQAVNPALICEYAGLSMEMAEKVYLHFDVDDTRVVAGLVKTAWA